MIFKTEQEAIDYSKKNQTETVEYKTYWRNGQLMFNCFYVNGKKHGEYKDYFTDGQLREYFFFVNGVLNGECKTYHENGELWQHYFFVNGKMFDVDHLSDGSYKSKCILNTLFSTLFSGKMFDGDI